MIFYILALVYFDLYATDTLAAMKISCQQQNRHPLSSIILVKCKEIIKTEIHNNNAYLSTIAKMHFVQ